MAYQPYSAGFKYWIQKKGFSKYKRPELEILIENASKKGYVSTDCKHCYHPMHSTKAKANYYAGMHTVTVPGYDKINTNKPKTAYFSFFHEVCAMYVYICLHVLHIQKYTKFYRYEHEAEMGAMSRDVIRDMIRAKEEEEDMKRKQEKKKEEEEIWREKAAKQNKNAMILKALLSAKKDKNKSTYFVILRKYRARLKWHKLLKSKCNRRRKSRWAKLLKMNK